MKLKTLVLMSAIALGSAHAVELTTDAQKLGYTIGADMGRSVNEIDKDGKYVDFNALIVGLKTAYEGKDLVLSQEDMDKVMQSFAEQRLASMQEEMNKAAQQNAEEGQKFLDENKGKDGVKTTASGLQYKVEKEGEGDKPKANDNVSVHYTGRLINGTVFDSSVERGEPVTFNVQEVIPGWVEGLQLMNKGAKYTFFIPGKLAYGEFGAGPSIPPNATLIFDVELLDIMPAEKGEAAPAANSIEKAGHDVAHALESAGEEVKKAGSEIGSALKAAEQEVKNVVQPEAPKAEGDKPAEAQKPAG